jgi:regulator of sigma E protease
VTVERDGELLDVPVKVPEEGLIGVIPVGELNKFFDLKTIEYSFLEAIPAGISRGMSTFSSYLKQLRMIFSPQTGAYRSLGGFITIGSIFPGSLGLADFLEHDRIFINCTCNNECVAYSCA